MKNKSKLGVLSMLGEMMGMTMSKGKAFQDSKDVQGKDEGRQTPIFSFGSTSNPIYIPSRSQKVKSKILAKRNSRR